MQIRNKLNTIKSTVAIVAAMSRNSVIGIDNKLPWHIPEDLKHFRDVTMGKAVIMGRKTFESIGRVLPGRKNIVISRNPQYNYDGVIVYSNLLTAIENNQDYDELCVIGGGEIFAMSMHFATKMYLTMVDIEISNTQGKNILFPAIDFDNWILQKQVKVVTNQGIICVFSEFFRK